MTVAIYFFLIFECDAGPDRLAFDSDQLFILLKSTIVIRSNVFPFKIAFFTSLSSFAVIKICFVSFVTIAGNKILRGVTLYMTFLYFFKIFNILSSSISIYTGFSPPTTSKFCCALSMTVSIGSSKFFFFFYQATWSKSHELFDHSCSHWYCRHEHVEISSCLLTIVFQQEILKNCSRQAILRLLL